MTFANMLKRLREDKDMSRQELADRIGVSYSSIAKYETPPEEGGRTPRYEIQERIANVFGCSIDYLNGRGRGLSAEDNKMVYNKKEETDFLGEIAFLATKGGGALTDEEIAILKNVFKLVKKRVEEREGK